VKHGLANHILDSGIMSCVVKSKGGGESPPHQTNAPNQCSGFGYQIRNGQCLGGGSLLSIPLFIRNKGSVIYRVLWYSQ
jgi:hypothetical protein